MPLVQQNEMKYTINPTRPATKAEEHADASSEREPKVYVSFNYVDLEWLIKMHAWANSSSKPGLETTPSTQPTAGPMLARMPLNWLDNWEGTVLAMVPMGEAALNPLYANILVKHNIKYETETVNAMENFDPDYDSLYVLYTDFTINSKDVKDAMRIKTAAFDTLQKIIDEKTDIKEVFLLTDSGVLGCTANDSYYPERPSGEEEPEYPPEWNDGEDEAATQSGSINPDEPG
ncbi:hypothetical protein [uncultured Duncaniella sp.]|uniref:hypothetical protein n=1 Tax=uncultured Duncaniella sp. TaxID=2768039 RepID=UPI002633E942|nr:hypothetical protein [uncultured Duncaniella sp.]